MSFVRIVATVGVSVGAAISAGVYFQPERPEVALRPAPPPAAASVAPSPSLIAGIHAEVAAPEVPTIAMLTPVETAAAQPVAPAPDLVASDLPAPEVGVVDAGCAMAVRVSAQPAAMLALTVDAPCDADEPVAIAHGPVLIATTLDAAGRAALSLPALAPEAEVSVALLDGRSGQSRVLVPDFAMYQRVVVTWNGPAVLDLHAFAGGAAWGSPGHVRAGGPISAATGFVSVLGDTSFPGAQARVYTYPVGISAASGHVAVEAEIAVTPLSCGQTFRAQVHALLGLGRTERRAVEVAMPACDSPAGFVQLPGLVPETPRSLAALD